MPNLLNKQEPASPHEAVPAQPSPRSPARWWQAALIVLVGWWVFSPAFHGGWLWDDDRDITQNTLLRSADGLWKIWFAPESVNYFPLKTTVQWVQWQLWQDHPLGYHLTNVGLHLLSALLLWRLFRKLGIRLAWLGGLLFAIHPVVVESVAWMTELKNTLSLPLLLLAMCAWLDYDERKRWRDYLCAVLLFFAAMLCKSLVVMFPLVLLLYAWWKRGRVTRADLTASAAFFAVSLGLGLVTVWFEHHRSIGSGIIPVGGFFPRLACAGLALSFYFSKCVFPAGLLPMYPRWNVNPPSLLQFLPWPLLGAVFYALWTRRATWGRHVLFGCGFFVLNLTPVLGFITISYMYIAWVADHFVYFSLPGLIGLASSGAGMAMDRLSDPVRRRAFGAAMAMVLMILAFQSHRHAGFFRNSETLWTYILQRNPEAWVAQTNLAVTRLQQGKGKEAIGYYEAALRLQPRSVPTHFSLGNVLLSLGRVAEAQQHYEEVLRIEPASSEAHNKLGVALAMAGRFPEAMSHYGAALRINPDYAEAHYNYARTLIQAGRVVEAMSHYEKILQLQPDSAEAHNNLGNGLTQLGRLPEAASHYEQVLRIKPDCAEAHYNLGNILIRLDRLPEAINCYEKAVRFRPDYAAAHYNWGSALLRLGRLPEAASQYEQVLRINPDDARARDNLELIRKQGFPPAANPEN